MKSMSAVKFNDVSISLDNNLILSNINLDVPKGMVYGLLGPSGAGKTTTVKIAAGILEGVPAKSVTILNEIMPSLSVMEKVGYMAQEEALYADLTGEQNLEFFGSLYGLNKVKLKERIDYVLDLVDLAEDRKKLVSKYSGGMKRRLSLAISILHEPDLLILDEPTVGIDPVLRQVLWNRLYEMADSGITILVTTHVMDEAEKCHRLAMIRNGRVIGEGTPNSLKQLYELETMEEVFLKLSDAEDLISCTTRGGVDDEN